jgi:hypothetical protein
MKEEWSVNASAEADESETDVVSVLKQMQQQLILLERKIDLLVSQSQKRPSGDKFSSDRPFPKRSFSKPFRSSEHSPRRHGKGEYGHSPRERDSAQGHFYEHRPRKNGRGPGPKKQFSFKRKDHE